MKETLEDVCQVLSPVECELGTQSPGFYGKSSCSQEEAYPRTGQCMRSWAEKNPRVLIAQPSSMVASSHVKLLRACSVARPNRDML